MTAEKAKYCKPATGNHNGGITWYQSQFSDGNSQLFTLYSVIKTRKHGPTDVTVTTWRVIKSQLPAYGMPAL